MKYIETFKSTVLVLLIFLSATLTFSIWTYSPKFETNVQPPPVDISVVDANKKELKGITEIVKPYKLLFNFEEGLKGTTDSNEIEQSIDAITGWTISNIVLTDSEFTEKELDTLLRKKNRFTLFYPGEVPLSVYDVVLNNKDSNIPEISFDRLIVDWNPASKAMEIHFVSRTNGTRYTGKITDYKSFNRTVLTSGRSYSDYIEVGPENPPYIAVPKNPVEIVSNTYIQGEINPSRFRDALFTDPNAVRRGQVSSSRELFQDVHAIMRVETLLKTLSFFHPVAESEDLAIPSDLLLDTIGFVNEHGGWTDDFRYTSMSPQSRKVKFQLYVQGLPVYSDTASTEIEQTWGDDRIYKYIRPYYTLTSTLPSEMKVVTLPPGTEVAEIIAQSEDVNLSTVEEIDLGYFMKYDTERRLFILEPSWFYLIKGKWIRYSPENLGGDMIGLE